MGTWRNGVMTVDDRIQQGNRITGMVYGMGWLVRLRTGVFRLGWKNPLLVLEDAFSFQLHGGVFASKRSFFFGFFWEQAKMGRENFEKESGDPGYENDCTHGDTVIIPHYAKKSF